VESTRNACISFQSYNVLSKTQENNIRQLAYPRERGKIVCQNSKPKQKTRRMQKPYGHTKKGLRVEHEQTLSEKLCSLQSKEQIFMQGVRLKS
jgi:hypothetical protein